MLASIEDEPCLSRDSANMAVRGFCSADRGLVEDLLASALDDLYPGGRAWLGRRLDDVAKGDARCSVALSGDRKLVGVTIEVPKPHQRVKLSTLFVTPGARRLGIASILLHRAEQAWKAEGVARVHLTAAHHIAGQVAAVLRPFGFQEVAFEWNRYGIGRHEVVLSWNPSKEL
jgi:GNAT superfamily N-acetyltransferase